ncbi:MAG: endolytic transglycosylase MltG [bacterium]|nr:endolytic transglycosylase MltG [bacterium]
MKSKYIILIIISAFISLIFLSITVFAFLVFVPLSFSSTSLQDVEITPKSSIKTIASNFKSQKLIWSDLVFEIYAKLGSARGQLKPGFYQFSQNQSTATMIDNLHKGKTATRKLTFIEGITNNEIGRKFSESGLGSQQEFEAALKDSYNYDFLAHRPSGVSLEGYLFPDTYIEKINLTAKGLVNDMLENFDEKISPFKETIAKNPDGLSLHQIITLASIVEHEGKTQEDRRLIAGILLNRLRQGMNLEADVTINYITGHKKTTADDLKIDSPYNTYKVKGLPPGPINNPGLESIEAVIFPTPSDYLFFISGKDGKIYYGRNLDEHNSNIARYLN